MDNARNFKQTAPTKRLPNKLMDEKDGGFRGLPERAHQELWDKAYNPLAKVKAFFKEAYLDAVVPVIAKTVKFHGEPETRILIIGGGKGHFTENVLPALKKTLRAMGVRTKLTVTESDISKTIREAGSGAKIADMLSLSKDLEGETFHIVISEDAVYKAGETRIGQAVSEIGKVAPNGTFLHFQSNTPSHWLGEERMRAAQLDRAFGPGGMAGGTAEATAFAHAMVLASLKEHALARGLGHGTFKIIGAADIPSRKLGIGGLDFGENNAMLFNMGQVSENYHPGIPKGRMMISYAAPAVVISSHPEHEKLFRMLETEKCEKLPL